MVWVNLQRSVSATLCGLVGFQRVFGRMTTLQLVGSHLLQSIRCRSSSSKQKVELSSHNMYSTSIIDCFEDPIRPVCSEAKRHWFGRSSSNHSQLCNVRWYASSSHLFHLKERRNRFVSVCTVYPSRIKLNPVMDSWILTFQWCIGIWNLLNLKCPLVFSFKQTQLNLLEKNSREVTKSW